MNSLANPNWEIVSFRSCVRASEAVCACEAVLLPVGRVWNGQLSSWARARARVPFPLVLSAYGKPFSKMFFVEPGDWFAMLVYSNWP